MWTVTILRPPLACDKLLVHALRSIPLHHGGDRFAHECIDDVSAFSESLCTFTAMCKPIISVIVIYVQHTSQNPLRLPSGPMLILPFIFFGLPPAPAITAEERF